jgi:hypothetical protein
MPELGDSRPSVACLARPCAGTRSLSDLFNDS